MWRSWLMWTAWPAFLAACLLEAGVFALVDPQDLGGPGAALGLSRLGVYTLAFFVFWIVAMASGGLTLLLSRASDVSGRTGR
ncbi:hypothetical protein [Variovorax terrae]|uniref:Transmembrane protein n=1 Tax=Variovorax terrae TaxID=2923278 RepID=A0A9X1VVQ5_9BURK|nr:hypothetical protein [Variovorax terrae]MCJ0762899.1 hypothetical protein [Variovorax terrae]